MTKAPAARPSRSSCAELGLEPPDAARAVSPAAARAHPGQRVRRPRARPGSGRGLLADAAPIPRVAVRAVSCSPVARAAAAALGPIRAALGGRDPAPRSRWTTRGGEDARRRSRGSRTRPSRPACAATTRWSRSAAASSPTWPDSRPRSSCAASPGTPCRRRRPAMADAAIGGKTGVNHRLGKNLLGAFHPPARDPRSIRRPWRRCRSATTAPASSRPTRPPGSPTRRSPRGPRPRSPAILARDERAAARPARRRGPRSRPRSSASDPTRRRTAAGCSTSATRSATRSRRRPASAACGTARPSRGASRRRSRSRGAAPACRRRTPARCARRSAALGPFPEPVRDAVAARALPRARQEGDRRADSRRSCSSGSARRAWTRPVPTAEWLEAAAIMSLS